MENNNNESQSKKMMIGIIMALLVIVSVTLYFVFTGHQDNTDLTAQKSALDSSFRSLSDTLDVKTAEIDRITANNVKLDSTITSNMAAIGTEKKQIAGLLSKAKMTKAELADAKEKIGQYETSISDLQKRVAELSAQNQQLTSENQQLSMDLTSEKKTTAELNEQNLVLAKKVEVGSLLQLTDVNVAGVKERQNGKEATVRKAKAAESIRVTFQTGENKILAPGAVSLYLRVINPKGETLAIANQGSGTLQLSETNTQVQYSKKADIDWNQSNKKVLVYWKQNISAAGLYKVEIYQSGYMIGKGEVKLD